MVASLAAPRVQGEIVATEAEAQAAAIYHMAQFTSWPNAEAPRDTMFVIGVACRSSVSDALKAMVRGKEIHGLPIVVVALDERPLPAKLKVFYIERLKDWHRYRQGLLGRPILCLSNHKNFLSKGGDIRVFREADHLELEIHLGHLKDRGLSVASPVLGLANRVYQEGED